MVLVVAYIPLINPVHNTENFKGRVNCFSMQVVMNKCFLLNPVKILAQIRLVVFEKNAKKLTFNFSTFSYSTVLTSQTVNRLQV